VDLGSIISLDPVKKLVRVEPMVSIGQLNDYLVKNGNGFSHIFMMENLLITAKKIKMI
jgi:hypothetical protein